MYFFVFCCTSPIICLIHLICLRPTSKVTPQEQPMEGEGNSFDEDNDDAMYLFADDESEYVEAELDEDSKSTEETEEPPPKRNFISIRRKIEIAEAAVRGRSIPGFTLRGLARDNNLQGNQIRRYIKSLPELRRLVHKKGGTQRSTLVDLHRWLMQRISVSGW